MLKNTASNTVRYEFSQTIRRVHLIFLYLALVIKYYITLKYKNEMKKMIWDK